MHQTIIILVSLISYYAIAWYGLAALDAGLISTSLVLYGLPAVVLAHLTYAPKVVLLAIAAFGAGLAVLFEGIAHINGLWYTLSAAESRIAGVVPLELLLAACLMAVFLVLLYESLFDDRRFTVRAARDRWWMFLLFVVAAGAGVWLHSFVTHSTHDPYSYLWLIGALVGATFVMTLSHKTLSAPFVTRLIDFSLIGSMPLAIGLWLAVKNTHKVFASPDYVALIDLFGATVPLEEVILLFVLPLTIATVYELYLDDVA